MSRLSSYLHTRLFLGKWSWGSLVLALLCLNAHGHELSAAEQQLLQDAALLAQNTCYKLIYRDPNAYVLCLQNLARPEPKASYKRLGIAYFGFVGAAAYMRVSQIGAAPAAAEFVKSYRETQKLLGVSDQALCSAVPGNCETRIAQSRQLETAPPKPVSMHLQCIKQNCRMVPDE